jgi:hypothetical protein
MEAGRTRWTDERIDDLVFEIRSLRVEMRDGFRELRSESGLNGRLLLGMSLTMMLGFAGLIVEAGLR